MKSFLKQLLEGALIGLVIGVMFLLLGYNIAKGIDSLLWYEWIILVIVLYIVYQLAIIFHELGHLIFGKLTGYKFLSYRYRSFLIMRNEKNKLVLKRFTVHGTLGQCLMIPPKKKPLPIFWYNVGGVTMNLLFAIVSIIVFKFVGNNDLIKISLTIVITINLFLAVFNWVGIKGLTNDGNNYREAKKYPDSRNALFYILDINARLSNNERITTMLLDVPFDELDLTKPLQINYAFSIVIKNIYLQNFELAKTQIDEILKTYNEPGSILILLIKPYKYLLMLIDEQEQAIDKKDKDVIKILDAMKYEPSFVLIKWYEELIRNNQNNDELSKQFLKVCENSPTQGEVFDLIEFKEVIYQIYLDKKTL
ncbi:M50 family metallopeptidase [Haploplasma axanthum]|uniref:Zn-dependent proteases n=1 Tax=Haploplasma axanthum TaxID=29552 RepID=A0A449BD90_HAPAX|nr:M50 family metallopeptidase [Haploplasma axanthum]VEU80431.1 Zn-dependent proteases [Haploplasma axanthum]